MTKRQAKKICRRSAWVVVKCMPYSCTPHRGSSVKAAIRRLRRAGDPVFYYEESTYKPTSFAESYWVDATARMNMLTESWRL